ncbi:hypothetical protein GCM10025854_07080 [Tetragenococcus muriaticus]|nr:hypothetical protein GCM10025854_07080 [Tetragenococcus muriaticus]
MPVILKKSLEGIIPSKDVYVYMVPPYFVKANAFTSASIRHIAMRYYDLFNGDIRAPLKIF